VKEITIPVKGPVFAYFDIDLVRFTYFFGSDLAYLKWEGGLSALGGEGCLVTPPLLVLVMGLMMGCSY
jgi:hypothetical protein